MRSMSVPSFARLAKLDTVVFQKWFAVDMQSTKEQFQDAHFISPLWAGTQCITQIQIAQWWVAIGKAPTRNKLGMVALFHRHLFGSGLAGTSWPCHSPSAQHVTPKTLYPNTGCARVWSRALPTNRCFWGCYSDAMLFKQWGPRSLHKHLCWDSDFRYGVRIAQKKVSTCSSLSNCLLHVGKVIVFECTLFSPERPLHVAPSLFGVTACKPSASKPFLTKEPRETSIRVKRTNLRELCLIVTVPFAQFVELLG